MRVLSKGWQALVHSRDQYRTVIKGSFNWSPSAAHTKEETLLAIHSPQLAQHFTREMNRLWDIAEGDHTTPAPQAATP